MRFMINSFFILTSMLCVFAKNNVKSLTESLGQEVIEIGGPDKGLPADLEEEPSVELEDEEEKMARTSTTLTVATKKDVKKTTTLIAERRKTKNYTKIEQDSKQDEEEMRIEKELAEIYKDNSDYKGDSSEATLKVALPNAIADDSKPIVRARPANFNFQPNLNNKAEVEKFRTSVDEISCEKRGQKLTFSPTNPTPTDDPNSGTKPENMTLFITNLLTFLTIGFTKFTF